MIRAALLLLACASYLSFGGHRLEAQIVCTVDFDLSFGNYQYGYTFAGYGDPNAGNVDLTSGTSQATEIAIGVGISGTGALRTMMDASTAGAQLPANRTYDYLGFASAANSGFAQSLPSGQLADYRLTLSARAEGFVAGVTNSTGELYLSISAPDGTLGASDGNADLLIGIRFSSGVALAEAFQTSSLELGLGTVADGSIANFNGFYTAANQVTFIVTPDAVNSRFGFDAGNAVIVDDINLVVVPEPASALTFAIGGLVLAGVRRRARV